MANCIFGTSTMTKRPIGGCHSAFIVFLKSIFSTRIQPGSAGSETECRKAHRNPVGALGGDRFGWTDLGNVAVARRAELAIDVGDQGVGVDHPDLGDSVGGVNADLAAEIVAKAGIGDLDDQQHIVPALVPWRDRAWPDAEIRLDETDFV